MSNNRTLPYNIDAEQAVLGAMMISDEALSYCTRILTVNDFYRQDHAVIFSTMDEMERVGIPVDLVTLSEQLVEDNKMEKAGGPALVLRLSNAVPTAKNVSYYAAIVKKMGLLRNMIYAATEIAGKAYELSDIDEILEFWADKYNDIMLQTEINNADKVHSFKELTDEAVTALKNNDTIGIFTGWKGFDAISKGLKAELYILAGMPGGGKTAFTIDMLLRLMERNYNSLYFSFEMSPKAMGLRLLSSASGTDISDIPANIIDEDDRHIWDRILEAKSKKEMCGDVRMYFNSSNIAKIRRICEVERAKKPFNAIFVDYLSLIERDKEDDKKNISADEEMKRLMIKLKNLTKLFNVPVIVLAQYNRNSISRASKKPELSDLIGGSRIEQTADQIIFLHRDDYNNPDSELKGYVEFIFAKNRNGISGQSIFMKYNRSIHKYEDVSLNFEEQNSKFVNLKVKEFWSKYKNINKKKNAGTVNYSGVKMLSGTANIMMTYYQELAYKKMSRNDRMIFNSLSESDKYKRIKAMTSEESAFFEQASQCPYYLNINVDNRREIEKLSLKLRYEFLEKLNEKPLTVTEICDLINYYLNTYLYNTKKAMIDLYDQEGDKKEIIGKYRVTYDKLPDEAKDKLLAIDSAMELEAKLQQYEISFAALKNEEYRALNNSEKSKFNAMTYADKLLWLEKHSERKFTPFNFNVVSNVHDIRILQSDCKAYEMLDNEAQINFVLQDIDFYVLEKIIKNKLNYLVDIEKSKIEGLSETEFIKFKEGIRKIRKRFVDIMTDEEIKVMIDMCYLDDDYIQSVLRKRVDSSILDIPVSAEDK